MTTDNRTRICNADEARELRDVFGNSMAGGLAASVVHHAERADAAETGYAQMADDLDRVSARLQEANDRADAAEARATAAEQECAQLRAIVDACAELRQTLGNRLKAAVTAERNRCLAIVRSERGACAESDGVTRWRAQRAERRIAEAT